MTIYVALDPGPLTGLAVWRTYDGPGAGPGYFESHEVSYREVPAAVRILPPWDHLITEKFTISGRTLKGAVYYESLYVNGWLDLEYGEQVLWQMPAIAKRETDPPSKKGRSSRHLKALGWYLKTENGHANDAAAHILSRAKTNRETYVLEGLADL